MYCKVLRLDGVWQDIIIPPQVAGRRCLDKVCEMLQLVERDLFGLSFRGKHGELLWLNLINPVRDQLVHAAPPPYQLDFRVKYFAAPQDIQRPETRRQFYLELKKQLLYGNFTQCEQLAKLVGLIAQVEWGDYDDAADDGGHYSSLVPPWQAHITGDARDYHLVLRGASAEACIRQFLEEVSGLEEYGTEYFDCKSEQHDVVELAVSKHGIVVFTSNRNMLDKYPAANISYVNYNKKCFMLELNNATSSSSTSSAVLSSYIVKFYFTTKTMARVVTRAVIEQLAFFHAYDTNVLGSLMSMVMRISEYKKLFECDITCTLEEMSTRVRFQHQRYPQSMPHARATTVAARSAMLRRAATVSCPSDEITGGRSRVYTPRAMSMGLEQGGGGDHGADENHGSGVRLAAAAADGADSGRWLENMVSGSRSAPNQSPISVDSGAVSGGTGRATHSEAEVEEINGEVEEINGEVEEINGEVEEINGEVEEINGEVEDDVTETEQYAGRMCKICLSNRLCTVFCPCGHCVCCQSCANNFQHCPICRAQVVRVQTVYFS